MRRNLILFEILILAAALSYNPQHSVQELRPPRTRFVSISERYPNSPEWVTGHIKTLAITRDGTVWVGSDSLRQGLHRTTDGGATWETVTRQDGLPSDQITALTTGPGDALWVGTDCGLVQTRDGGETWSSFAVLPRLERPHIRNVAVGADGTVWVITKSDIVFSQDGGIHWHASGREAHNPPWPSYWPLAVDANGTAYYASPNNEVAVHEPDGEFCGVDSDHLVCVVVTTAVCQFGGVHTYSPQEKEWKWTGISTDGSICADIYDLAVTPDGTLWVADFDSFYVVEGRGYRASWKSLSGRAMSIGPASDGGVWAGQYGFVVHYWRDDKSILTGPGISGLPCSLINVIAEAPDGTIWVGTDAGLYTAQP